MARKLTHNEFLQGITAKDIEILGKYVNNHTPILCRCKRCGNEWNARPYHLKSGHGCNVCAVNNTSYVEQFIYKAFADVLGADKVENRNKTAIGSELDIYIPTLNLAIEPGTWAFHKNKLANDYAKKQKCKENGINLVIIYYECKRGFTDYKGICNKYYDDNIAFNRERIKDMLCYLFEVANIRTDFTVGWLDSLDKYAFTMSRRMTHEDFIKLPTISPTIDIISEYKGHGEKIKCKCKVCANEWEIKAYYVAIGRGCKACANRQTAQKRKKSVSEYAEELKTIHPGIEVIGEYINATTKTKHRCNVCGYEWDGTPNHILRPQGTGCPKCSKGARRTHEQFLKDMEQISPNIEILGTFTNTRTRVKSKCKICGNVWEPFANDLLRGCKCGACYRSRGKADNKQ